MAPAYKLMYFDGRGIVEPARFLFIYGGIDFEDFRIKKVDWSQYKDKTPFGQVPVLEHNGKQVGQSLAIIRYLGHVVKLAGNDAWENLEIDAVVDTLNDLRLKLNKTIVEKDEEKLRIAKEGGINETIPYYFTRIEANAKENNGYLALGRLTWADLYLVSMLAAYDTYVGANPLEKYPTLQALRDKVEAIPAIKKWIQTRPVTSF